MRRSRVRPGVYRGVLWTRKKPTPRQQPSTTGTRPNRATARDTPVRGGCRTGVPVPAAHGVVEEYAVGDTPSDLCRLRTGAPLV